MIDEEIAVSRFNQRLNTIETALNAFETSLTPQRPSDLGAFVRGRIALSRSVSEFLSHEWQNLEQNIVLRTGGMRHEQESTQRAFVSLRADYSHHVARWNSDRLVREWPDYRKECGSLIRQMRHLLGVRFGSAVLAMA